MLRETFVAVKDPWRALAVGAHSAAATLALSLHTTGHRFDDATAIVKIREWIQLDQNVL